MADDNSTDIPKLPVRGSTASKLSTTTEPEAVRLVTKAAKPTEKTVKKKKTGLKLATARVKSIGGLTPCSSPAEGQMFMSSLGPDWKRAEAEVSQAFQVNQKPN